MFCRYLTFFIKQKKSLHMTNFSDSKLILIVVGCLLLIGGCNSCTSYNTMISKGERVEASWSQVENVYQRRSDLIPNLVKTVQGAANFEKSTLEAVVNARAAATQVKLDPANLTPKNIKAFQEAQEGLSGALSKLLMITENYPELKANANFRDLQSQLEGTENRIAQERKLFNESVKEYNQYIKKFPTNIWAGMFNFDNKSYFEAEQGAEKAPSVQFE